MSDNNLPFIDVRAVFEKKGAAVYFSHLDLTRTVARALRRSKQDIWLTQGFTPRPHIVFTPPLSLGYESECEIIDFRLNLGATFDEEKFKAAFPSALKIKEIYYPETKLGQIAYAKDSIRFETEADKEQVTELFSKPIMLLKKTKRSEKTVDITKFIESLDCEKSENILKITTILHLSGESSLSPAYIVTALLQNGIAVDKLKVTRLEFLRSDFQKFK